MVIHAISHAFFTSLTMFWQILWPLILGFSISGVIQAVVSHKQISKLMPDDKPKSLAIACGLGASSSSCSYAAVAIARSIFRKGANFTSAMVFEIASTNLVIELGVILAVLIGWQFTLAEFIGGPLMIIILALLFRLFVTPKIVAGALKQAEKDLSGKMEGHAAMDMSVGGSRSLIRKLFSKEGKTATSHFFVMDWASIWLDIVAGLLIAGALAAWVPKPWWQALFFTSNHIWSIIWGPLIGPIVAMASFVCSVGNVPLAAVLWHGGISFGGVVSFIFADLIIIPILRIYIKYYGKKMAMLIFVLFYLAMAIAGYITEGIFSLLHLVPTSRNLNLLTYHLSFDYTTILNIIFLILAALMVYRFMKTGGPMMLKMMNKKAGNHSHHS